VVAVGHGRVQVALQCNYLDGVDSLVTSDMHSIQRDIGCISLKF